MPSFYILKTGSTFPDLAARQGDFDHWIDERLSQTTLPVHTLDAHSDTPLPDIGAIAGLIITGSHAMVTDREAWSERIAAWLPRLVSTGIPVLGICYGHQLLAHATGGVVDYHPRGKEVGTVPLSLTEAAASDPLLSHLPAAFYAHATHSQSVIQLPPDAVLLARNSFESHHAFRLGECAWGVQFHPEFDADIMRHYVLQQADALRRDGQNPAALADNVRETPVALQVLSEFARFVINRQSGDQLSAAS